MPDLKAFLSSVLSLFGGWPEQYFDTCNEVLYFGNPGTHLLLRKTHQILIVSLLSTLEEVSIQHTQPRRNSSGPDKVTIQ